MSRLASDPPRAYLRQILEEEPWKDITSLSRFLLYAGYVRHLVFVDTPVVLSDPDGLSAKLLRIIARRISPAPVFPNLQELNWDYFVPDDPFPVEIIGPSLRALVLDYLQEEGEGDPPLNWDQLRSVLDRLRENSPYLDTFQICGGHRVRRQLIKQLVLLPRVRRLEIPCVDNFVDLHLLVTALDALEFLETCIQFDETHDTSFQPVLAPRLRDVRLAGTGEAINLLFSTLSLPRLEKVNIQIVDDEVSERGIYPYPNTASIARAATASSLRTVIISPEYKVTYAPGCTPCPDHVYEVSLLHILRPLFGMRNLERLDFWLNENDPIRVSACDDDFVELAQAWPALRVLDLVLNASHAVASAPTLHTLTHLARCCPALGHVTIPFLDLSMMDGLSSSADADTPLHPLRSLSIDLKRRPPVYTPTQIAQLRKVVHGLFPRAELTLGRH